MTDDDEIAEAGALLGELLTSSLCPKSGSWNNARPTYIWEHNALCWLARNRARVGPMCAWASMLVEKGYPAKPFISGDGQPLPAGAWWNASMEPKRGD
jgi:hypothetical protein